LIIRIYWR